MKHQYLFVALLLSLLLAACGQQKKNQSTQENQPAVPSAFVSTAPQQQKAASATSQAGSVVQYELPAATPGELILKRKGYTVSYNKSTRCPNWVAWHLTKNHTYGRVQRSDMKFTEDADIAKPRATDQDYYNSRYDRGHMCPAGDNKWDATAMQQTFLLTNICPQNHGLNKYEWNDLEMLCRDWARKYGAIDIVCGPIYDNPTTPKTIGKNRVAVPDRFFKVVLCRQGRGRAIGFIYRNEGKKQPMEQAVCTVDNVELITGLDFFPSLRDDIESRVESVANLSEW